MTDFDYGKRISYLRQLNSLTPKMLADKTGLHISSIYKIESGNSKPSLDSLEDMCKVFNISLQEFFIIIEEKSK